MADVVGLTVWVKLKQPSDNIVYGRVQNLVPNSHLTLQDVLFSASGKRLPHWTVQAAAIDNLEVINPTTVPRSSTHPDGPIQPPQSALGASFTANTLPSTNRKPSDHAAIPEQAPSSRHVSQPQPPVFVDSAILSYSASPAPKAKDSRSIPLETPVKAMLARAAQNLPSPTSPFIADAGNVNGAQKWPIAGRLPLQSAKLQPEATAPANVVSTTPAAEPTDEKQEMAAKKATKRKQRSKKGNSATAETHDPPPVMNIEVSRNGNNMGGSVKRGKGWRSTPLLQPFPQPEVTSDKAASRKNTRKRKEELEFAEGDTTDIQDWGDFDFEGELKKFDKKLVFDEIRQGDTTADEDRLVSHNKAHRPGTYGGKNLHPTEPVLSPKLDAKYNSGELESSSDADTEMNFANGRSSSRHSITRALHGKMAPSRKNSGNEAKSHPLSSSMYSERSMKGSATSLSTREAKAATSMPASSPQLDAMPSPRSNVSLSKATNSKTSVPSSAEPHFAIQPSSIHCPTLLPRALESLEDATIATFGLLRDTFTETAARSIAEAAMALAEINGGETRRPSRANLSRTNTGNKTTQPMTPSVNEIYPHTVVVLAGNHLVGSRALAAARHLASRNVHVIAVEASGIQDHTSTTSSAGDHTATPMKVQAAILKKMSRSGGSARIKRGPWRRVSRDIKNLAGPPAVIIDALLAGSSYEPIASAPSPSNPPPSTSNAAVQLQQDVREMIDWANRSRARVLSLACPSGVSGEDGRAPTIDGEPLAVRPDRVLALGVPVQGLLHAMQARENWRISLADLGINIALKSEEAVAFDRQWVVELKYVDEQEGEVS